MQQTNSKRRKIYSWIEEKPEYGDVAGNTAEENSSISSLIQMR